MFKKLMEKIMAKNKKKEFLQEIAPVGEEEIDEIAKKVAEEEIEPFEVEEIAERVAGEEIEEIEWDARRERIEEMQLAAEGMQGKKNKQDFLKSKGLHDRPNSHMAIKAWEDYQDSFYDM